MALPDFSMRQLLEAGVHFGHQTHRWNPKMEPFLFGDRNNIHIIDLAQTVPLLHQALVAVRDAVAGGGRVLFVGTKRQASDPVAQAAKQCAQYYINHRWLGGMLTNWKTISNSIRRLRQLDEMLSGEAKGLTKKEVLNLTRERDKLERAIGGIKDMGGLPDLIFVIDTNKEDIAIQEARKLGIPVVGSSTPIPIPMASPIRFRAMTTRPARFRFIAISSPARSSTVSRRAMPRRAPMSEPKQSLSSRCRRPPTKAFAVPLHTITEEIQWLKSPRAW